MGLFAYFVNDFTAKWNSEVGAD